MRNKQKYKLGYENPKVDEFAKWIENSNNSDKE